MRLTPQDLRRAQFGAAVRGFNRTEVASFLEEVADDLELALRSAERARQEVSALQDQLAVHRRRETTPRDTVLDAQRASATQDERNLVNQGSHVSAIIALYKALGGGWSDTPVDQWVSGEVREAMQQRTDWGELLTAPLPEGRASTESPPTTKASTHE